MTFKDEILNAANGEIIEAITVSKFDRYYDLNDDATHDMKGFPIDMCNKLQLWSDVAEYLDYNYDAGYGGADCHAITAWTYNKVIFVHEYDGATWVTAVPRNPVNNHESGYGS